MTLKFLTLTQKLPQKWRKPEREKKESDLEWNLQLELLYALVCILGFYTKAFNFDTKIAPKWRKTEREKKKRDLELGNLPIVPEASPPP